MAPGMAMVIAPPQAHMHWEPIVSAGVPATTVRSAPGTHVPTTAGTHGMGVNTPSAAVVAAATMGLARLIHIPNGGTFSIGTVSVVTAAGLPSISTRGMGSAFNVDGAAPKVHWMRAPWVAFSGIDGRYFFDPRAEDVSVDPAVVMKQMTLRSVPCSQLRAEGSR